jgi:hypothetical protein
MRTYSAPSRIDETTGRTDLCVLRYTNTKDVCECRPDARPCRLQMPCDSPFDPMSEVGPRNSRLEQAQKRRGQE